MGFGKVRYRPQGATLCKFGQATSSVQIMRGPLGSGKTKAAVFKIIKLLAEQKPDANGVRRSRVGAIRNTYPDLQTTTIREFKECVSPAMGSFRNGHPPTFVFSFKLPDDTTVEAEIDFLALDRAEDVKKLRGTQYTFIWLNETKELPKAVLDMALGRIDRYPTPGFSAWVGVLGDTNAWDEDHWLATLEEQSLLGLLPGYEFFTQPGAVIKTDGADTDGVQSLNGTYWKVNPLAENLVVLRSDYYKRQIAGKKDDWIKVNLGNEIGLAIDGKAVHSEYQESVHRSKEVLKPRLGMIHVGLDFGLTPAALFWQQQPSGQWYALDEIAMEQGDAVSLSNEIKKKVAEMRNELHISPRDEDSLKFVFRGDPSGNSGSQADSSTPFRIMAGNGIVALPASTNDPAIRRNALTRVLTRMVNGQPGVLISPKCKILRKGLAGGFHYKRVKVAGDDRYHDVPNKNFFSHVCEAAEYGLLDAGEHAVINSQQARATPRYPVTPHRSVVGQGAAWDVFGV